MRKLVVRLSYNIISLVRSDVKIRLRRFFKIELLKVV